MTEKMLLNPITTTAQWFNDLISSADKVTLDARFGQVWRGYIDVMIQNNGGSVVRIEHYKTAVVGEGVKINVGDSIVIRIPALDDDYKEISLIALYDNPAVTYMILGAYPDK